MINMRRIIFLICFLTIFASSIYAREEEFEMSAEEKDRIAACGEIINIKNQEWAVRKISKK